MSAAASPLDEVLEAHGGMERWRAASAIPTMVWIELGDIVVDA